MPPRSRRNLGARPGRTNLQANPPKKRKQQQTGKGLSPEKDGGGPTPRTSNAEGGVVTPGTSHQDTSCNKEPSKKAGRPPHSVKQKELSPPTGEGGSFRDLSPDKDEGGPTPPHTPVEGHPPTCSTPIPREKEGNTPRRSPRIKKQVKSVALHLLVNHCCLV